jgi:Pregnancy-associated plasma protein-A
MRAVLWFLLVPAVAVAAPPTVRDSMMSIEGQVMTAASHWTRDGSRIVTEATVMTPKGPITVSQLGGTVDKLTMRTWPGPEILVPGMQVALTAYESWDLSQRKHNILDGVKVLSTPPGFVRTGPTKANNYLYWESGCVYVTPDAEGTKAIPGDLELQIIDDVIAVWNTGVSSCSYMNIVRETPKAIEVGKDKVNVIKFRDVSWCRPATADDAIRCHAPSAAGLTTAVFVDDADSDRDGAIVDADIELNGVDFAISANDMSLGTATCKSDLANTLTHEMGHLLGLEHPCRTGGDPARVDGEGNMVPSCGATTDAKILDATMYNFQDCGETKKATLSQDDTDAVCRIYPIAEDPKSCDHVSDSAGCAGCSTGGSPWVGFVLSALTFGLLVGRRKTKNSARA